MEFFETNTDNAIHRYLSYSSCDTLREVWSQHEIHDLFDLQGEQGSMLCMASIHPNSPFTLEGEVDDSAVPLKLQITEAEPTPKVNRKYI